MCNLFIASTAFDAAYTDFFYVYKVYGMYSSVLNEIWILTAVQLLQSSTIEITDKNVFFKPEFEPYSSIG